MKRGYLQVYTGEGKGKTTAALGLVLRAGGAGLRVYFGQFIKGQACSELETLRTRFPEVTIEQFGRGCFIRGKPTAADKRAVKRGVERIREALVSGRYDVVVADEANCAVACGAMSREALMELVRRRPAGVELVVTGRAACPELIEAADLVTEMRAVKHYYDRGVRARRGIEC